MKFYGDYINSSITMKNDDLLISLLEKLATSNKIEYIVESGTYLGLGSTTMLAKAFVNNPILKKLITLEVDYDHFIKAKKNLSEYKFVECLYGCSVYKEKAVEFITNDYPLNNHLEFSDVYIDNIDNPVKFYLDEVNGKLFDKNNSFFKKIFHKQREYNLIEKLVKKYNFDANALFVLDSAGGIGFLEFSKLDTLMKNKEYFILLDDIHHLKHFRGREIIKTRGDFELLGESESHGWILAKHLFN